jgi:hypothetical protein
MCGQILVMLLRGPGAVDRHLSLEKRLMSGNAEDDMEGCSAHIVAMLLEREIVSWIW